MGKAQRAHAPIQSFPKLAFVQNPSRQLFASSNWRQSVKAGIRPINKLRYQSMLERVGVDVIYMAFHIGIIPYLVFPDWRCQMPFSRLNNLLELRASDGLRFRENPELIRLQRGG